MCVLVSHVWVMVGLDIWCIVGCLGGGGAQSCLSNKHLFLCMHVQVLQVCMILEMLFFLTATHRDLASYKGSNEIFVIVVV
ncbi:hypothetical protein L6452_13717 [Arctium lappa]|uniref:Uncharacterized protein n=1 Tax=Arctium lappa TaxID=4217 RepID=A0ACB9CJ00_ARCLA|nr:hypothetical protein L6452_13717 [Arctium lappa]